MKIKNLDELNTKVTEETSWRKFEIISLLSLCTSNIGDIKKIYLRASHTMIYAHFEGCIKALSEYYLNFISYQRIPFIEMSIPIAAAALKSKINEFIDTKKSSKYIDIYKIILENTDKHNISSNYCIDSNANLNSKMFTEICFCIGMDETLYLSKLPNIDEKLCKIRHEIAHGKKLEIIENDFKEVSDMVLEIIDTYSTQIILLATQKKYKK